MRALLIEKARDGRRQLQSLHKRGIKQFCRVSAKVFLYLLKAGVAVFTYLFQENSKNCKIRRRLWYPL